MKRCQYWWSITRALLKRPYWLYTRSTYFTFSVPATFLNCVKWPSFSSHFIGSHWWIGGERRSQVWYWTGVQTGVIPAYGTDQSHWYFDPKTHINECMLLWTDGNDDISNDGWFNTLSCSSGLNYICEKKHQISLWKFHLIIISHLFEYTCNWKNWKTIYRRLQYYTRFSEIRLYQLIEK